MDKISPEANQTAHYLVKCFEAQIIERIFTLVDATAGGDSSIVAVPTFGVSDKYEFIVPSLSVLQELHDHGLISLREGYTSRGSRKWDVSIRQELLHTVTSDLFSNPNTLSTGMTARIFISYRRLTSATLAQLISVKLKDFGIEAFFDTQQIDGAGLFPNRLKRAIENCDILVCLLADTTLESNWVITEIEYAHTLGKPMIPVFQESYRPSNGSESEAINTLKNHDGIQILDIKNVYINDAIRDLAIMIKNTPKSISTQVPSEHTLRFRKEYKVWGNNEKGVNTEIRLLPGDLLDISAFGTVIFDKHGTEADPDGYFFQPKLSNSRVQWRYENARKTKDGSNFVGSLFGWINESTKDKSFFIGKNYKGIVSEPDNGILFLCVNDGLGEYDDNQGYFEVRVDVYRNGS